MYKRVTTVGASPPPGGRHDRMVVGLQQSVESVPITSKVVSLNPAYVLQTPLCDKVCQ